MKFKVLFSYNCVCVKNLSVKHFFDVKMFKDIILDIC